jgi:SAM-dependent methyltransferase
MSLWSDFQQHRGRLIHKWEQYFPAYERHFARFRNQAVVVLEIGVGEGGSLQLWRRFFGPHARIIGIDTRPEAAAFAEHLVAVRIGDATAPAFLDGVLAEFGPVQVIIDDGSHMMPDVQRTFAHLYHHPAFDTNGVYAVEDLHTAYWPEFGGGFRREGSFIETAKGHIDQLHAAHARGAFPATAFTAATLSMHIYDSLVIYERGRRVPNLSMMADASGVRGVQLILRQADAG